MVTAHREPKSYYVQRDIRRKTTRVVVGRPDLMDASELASGLRSSLPRWQTASTRTISGHKRKRRASRSALRVDSGGAGRPSAAFRAPVTRLRSFGSGRAAGPTGYAPSATPPVTHTIDLKDTIQAHFYERKKERSEKTLKECEKSFSTHHSDFMVSTFRHDGPGVTPDVVRRQCRSGMGCSSGAPGLPPDATHCAVAAGQLKPAVRLGCPCLDFRAPGFS